MASKYCYRASKDTEVPSVGKYPAHVSLKHPYMNIPGRRGKKKKKCIHAICCTLFIVVLL